MKLLRSQSGHGHLAMIALLVVTAVGFVGFQVFRNSSNSSTDEPSSYGLLRVSPESKAGIVITPTTNGRCPAGAKLVGHSDRPNECHYNVPAYNPDPKPTEAKAQVKYEKKEERKKKKAIKTQGGKRKSAAVQGAITSTPEATTDDNQAPEVAATSNYTSVPPVPTEKPEVNIIAFTYVKEEGKPKARIGGVGIKIARKGGDEKCDKKRTSGKTNRTHKNKDGDLVRGTIHFKGCTAGEYTITASTRKGYKLVSDPVRNTKLEDGETVKVHYTLEKLPKKKKSSSPSSEQQTGGVQAPN